MTSRITTIRRSKGPCVRSLLPLAMLAVALTAQSAAAQGLELFNNMNTAGVLNGPSAPTSFTVNGPVVVDYIQTYHWNNGRGAMAGTIALRDQGGRIYGPFRATATSGYAGAQNVNWVANSMAVALPAGTYTILDSDPRTWSQNPQSGGRGFAIVRGALQVSRLPLPGPRPAPTPTPAPTPVSSSACANPQMVQVRNLSYANYTGAASLLTPTVAGGGFLQIQAGCIPLDGEVRVILTDGVTLPLRLTNVRVNGTIVSAQVAPIFAGRTWNVELYVLGRPWKVAFVGQVAVQ